VSRQRPVGVGGVRVAAVAGCLGLVATGVNVLLMPAAIVGLLAGVSGVRRAGDDLDAASLRLGVALLISVLLSLFTLMSGSGVLAATGVVTVAMFTLAWRGCEQLRRARRADWGVRQREILDRQAQLHQRREALRNAPVDAKKPRDERSGPGVGQSVSPDHD
jgi:hypothetical protein